jgi:SAM-dependent methyltransferase
MNYFKRIQVKYIIDGQPKLIGKLFTFGYRHAMLFDWLRNLKLHKDAYVLDIGSGDGDELKRMYQLGFRNLTGVDPFIPRNYHFTESFNIYKKEPLALNNESTFDCIMMHHSFEHMEKQKEVLKHIKHLLKPSGKVLIRIPLVSDTLLKRYGSNLVSLDAPRHIYIHSLKSMQMLCHEVGFKIQQIAFDAEEFSFWASEQYAKGICLNAPNSYARTREKSMFTKGMIKEFKKQITELNHKGESDNAAFYLNLL